MVKLLDKMRKISRILQSSYENRIEFDDISKILSEVLASNVLIISEKGKVLSKFLVSVQKIDSSLLTHTKGRKIDSALSDRLLNILSTKENVNLLTLGFLEEDVTSKETIIIPVYFASRRLGTIFAYRDNKQYFVEDIILGEYAATVIGLELLSSLKAEEHDKERKELFVKSAFSTLSYSEQIAIKHIMSELKGEEGIIIASRVADTYGLTRSVIVNAIRKCESAGVLESKSLGMKGTYIKIINEFFLAEVQRI